MSKFWRNFISNGSTRFWRHFTTNGSSPGQTEHLREHDLLIRLRLGLRAWNVVLSPVLSRRHSLGQATAVFAGGVLAGSPAEAAGIMEDDLLVSLGDEPISSMGDLHRQLKGLPAAIPVSVQFLRGGRLLERLLIPNEHPRRTPKLR